ncbi:50S ribosomal protein L18 [Candidatus Gracilibacteria bacterium]|jgi:large subunit ribosomal protein L18|nr:50S ribosomal protein L18 [Candidatus Gracilibacteria bacterium]
MPTTQSVRLQRRNRIKAKLHANSDRPCVVVYRSLNYIYGQLIDTAKQSVLVSSSDLAEKTKGTKMERAHAIGKLLGEKILAQNIKEIAFDRNGYKYHGRVKALATGLRDAGLQF